MCKYCDVDILDDIGTWIFDDTFIIRDQEYAAGVALCPWAKQLDFNIVTSPVIKREVLTKRIDINYCPFCGRELISREELMTLERFLDRYDGNCAISVIKENGDQLCAVQELNGIEHDEWYNECKASEVLTFKIVPDDYEDGAVVLLITIK